MNSLPISPLRPTPLRPAPRRKRRGPLLLLAALFSLVTLHSSLAAPPAQPNPSRTFVQASLAYDENRLPDAIAAWQSLLDDGYVLPPVLFNLGNAHYRSGHLGEAIRAYRHAQWLAPRDPDIRANLGFAAQTAGISLPSPPAPLAFLLSLTTREWLLLALLFYLLLSLLAALALLLPRLRPALKTPAVLLALLLLLSLAGIAARHHAAHANEAVLLADATLLSGPLDTATPLLSLPAGTLLRAGDLHGPWRQVQPLPDLPSGWLPASSLAPVLPK